jgi:CBS domain containing-hemolysin-like protein
LKFDEEKVETAAIPYRKSIFLSSEMNWKEVYEIYLKHSFSCYPVWKKKKIIGILNFKFINLFVVDKKVENWQQFISEEIVFLSVDAKLSAACDILKKTPHHLAIIIKKGRTVGLITLGDVLEKLIGKINHNKK